ncbi:unnamed protein product, partial [Gulo gulo]
SCCCSLWLSLPWVICLQGEVNLSGAGRARGPAGLTVQGKKPTCTCAQMPPCAASPMESGLWPLSLNMWSWFWGWHPCS